MTTAVAMGMEGVGTSEDHLRSISSFRRLRQNRSGGPVRGGRGGVAIGQRCMAVETEVVLIWSS
jgi:hypothetical protein